MVQSSQCTLCPRECGVQRAVQPGRCGAGDLPVVARAALHFWEEPCISGTRGSGTVFFSGCPLGCVFCQNEQISAHLYGKTLDAAALRACFGRLIDKGAHNINLVSPTPYVPVLCQALAKPLAVPVVYNTSGYEKAETLRLLAGKIQIYLPDFKYASAHCAARYAGAPDYPQRILPALEEMYRQVGDCVFDAHGVMQKGMIVRHLILPGQVENALDVLDAFAAFARGKKVLFSLMSQYIPCARAARYPEINRKITREEYQRVENHLLFLGITKGYVQDFDAADDGYIPPFDLTGL